jgi:hypothetical protein
MPNQFTIYRSSDSGAPTLSGTAGDLVNLLDKCLVTGWTASVTSITRSGSTATVTTAGNHGLVTGNSTTIAGAGQAEYNGTFTVTVVSATVFTITVSGTPATPATGTITWAKLAAGWTKPFTGTNKAVFRQGAGNQFYWRVDDNGPGAGGAREARIRGFEAMSDVDTGTGTNASGFPSTAQQANGLVARKSTTADATTRTWMVIADDRTVMVFIQTGDIAGRWQGFALIDIYSYVASDGFRTMIIGGIGENSASASRFTELTTTMAAAANGHYIARGYVGTGGPIQIGKHSDAVKAGGSNFMTYGLPYPNPTDGYLYLSPLWITDPTTAPVNHIRGQVRGVYNCLCNTTTLNDLDTFDGVGDLAGKSFLLIKNVRNATSDGDVVIEISNTVQVN